jgi:hypothetical protein
MAAREDEIETGGHGAPEGAFALDARSVPLPDPFQAAYGAGEPPPRGLWPALRAGLAHAWASKRALGFVLAAQLLFALTIVTPLAARLRTHLDAHAHAPALAGVPDAIDEAAGWGAGLDAGVWADLRRKDAAFFEGLDLALAWVLVASWLFGAFVAGGFLSTAAHVRTWTGERPKSAGFLAGGGRWFGPMLRTSLLFAVLYALVGRVVFETWDAFAKESEARTADGAAQWWGNRTREAVFVVVFLLLRVVADLGRARLVAFEKRSAVLAFFRGFLSLFRHPVRVLGLAGIAAALEALAFLACAALLALVPGGALWPDLLVAFVVFQVAVLARWSTRVVVLAGYVHLLRAHAAARGSP